MTVFRLSKFGGTAPKVSARLLPPHLAQTAKNCDLRQGDLRPLNGNTFIWTPTKIGTIQSIHRFAGAFWFHWTSDVDVVRGPIAGDTTERTLYTGDGYPKVTDNSIATTGGGSDYPINAYRLGLPAPSSAPSANTINTCEEADQTSLAAVYTYVTGWGEEGPPSAASVVIDACEGDSVVIGGMGPPSGNYNVVAYRVYIDIGNGYQYAAEVAVGPTEVGFEFHADSLGEVCPSLIWDQPPDAMQGIISLPNGILMGFAGNEVIPSERWVPHAYPSDYRLTTDYPIVGLAACGNAVVVGTTGTPYLCMGTDPSSLALTKLEDMQACVSKRSMVDMGAFAIYASPDGLVTISPSGSVNLITKPYITRAQWQALNPSSIHAYHWEGAYVGFYDTGAVQGGFIFDPTVEGITFFDAYATAGYNDLEEDALYLVIDGDIVRWSDATALAYTWRSKRFASAPVNLGAAIVFAESYPLTLRMYGDGVLKATATVNDSRAFRLPGGYRATEWEFEFEGSAPVQEAVFASTMAEIRAIL